MHIAIGNRIGKCFNWAAWWATRYPSGLLLTVNSDTQITISHTNNGTQDYDEICYNINGTETVTDVPGTTSKPLTGLTAGTLYTVKIRYRKGTHYSDYSNTDIAATLDSYGQAFITATGISDGTSVTAISNLVYDLLQINSTQANFVNFGTPASSICRAIYPFVGSTATSQKYNLIDPRDLDAAFRLTWINDTVGAHTSSGYDPNGSDQMADTKLNASTILSADNSHLSVYHLEDIAGGYDIGTYSGSNNFYLRSRGTTDLFRNIMYGASGGVIDRSCCNSIAFFIGSRTSAVYMFSMRDGIGQGALGTTNRVLPNRTVTIGGITDGSSPLYSAKLTGFASIGKGITVDAAFLYDAAVYKYMLKMGRVIARPTSTIHAGVCFTIDDTGSLASAKTLINCHSYYGFTATNFLNDITYTAGEVSDGNLFLGIDCELGTHVNIAPRTDPVATVWANQIYPVHNGIHSYFGVIPRSFAYHVTAEVDEELLTYLQSEHNYVNIRVTETETGTPYYVNGNEIIGATLLSNLTTYAAIKALIDYAYANNKILIIYMHKIGAAIDALTTEYALAERLIALVKAYNMTFYKFSELIAGV